MTDTTHPTIHLHNHGFVQLIDVMGDDQAIVDAARVSYAKGTKTTRNNRGLIRYLFSHAHGTPFEACVLKFCIKAPIFVVRQWQRHRSGSFNEESARYSVIEDHFYSPASECVKRQSDQNKQGGGEAFSEVDALLLSDGMHIMNLQSHRYYQALLDRDIARETARMVLPVATYTTMYWMVNLRNLLHFLTLRADPHAQQEIRDYAEAIIDLVAPLFPLTFEAWEDYQRQAKTFSRMDLALLQAIMRRFTSPQASLYALVDEHRGVERLGAAYGMTKREIVAFFDKVGVAVPEGG